jgi:hypothetical protein
MSSQIPYTEDTFRPTSLKGNSTADHPVEFDLCTVGGPGRARLKSIIIATSGLAGALDWSPETQESVIAAFRTGAAVFHEGVLAIRNLSAPARLLKRVGLIAEYAKGVEPTTPLPVTSGAEFAAVCGHMPTLAFEVAMALSKLCKQGDIDPRFFRLAWFFGTGGAASEPGWKCSTCRPEIRRKRNCGLRDAQGRQPAYHVPDAVFGPDPERGVTVPVYWYGRGRVKDAVFTCPVSAVDPGVWDLLNLFFESRAMRLPVKPGGLLDQPIVVRRAFPIWESEMTRLERDEQASTQFTAMATLFGIRGGQ